MTYKFKNLKKTKRKSNRKNNRKSNRKSNRKNNRKSNRKINRKKVNNRRGGGGGGLWKWIHNNKNTYSGYSDAAFQEALDLAGRPLSPAQQQQQRRQQHDLNVKLLKDQHINYINNLMLNPTKKMKLIGYITNNNWKMAVIELRYLSIQFEFADIESDLEALRYDIINTWETYRPGSRIEEIYNYISTKNFESALYLSATPEERNELLEIFKSL